MEKKKQSMSVLEKQEAEELKLLNTQTDERLAYQEHQEEITRKINEERRAAFIEAEKEKKIRMAYANKSAASVAALLVLSGAVCAAGMADMMHPYIWVSTALVSLCAACVRFGVWFGRVAK